jgi:CopG family transcriptional regulator/antitoxin EndoAI
MLRTTKLITISIMPELLKKLNQAAKEESRTRSELLREALRRYLAEREWQRLRRYGFKKAREMNLKQEDVERLIDEYRSEQSHD